jgi:hypothetical protein
MNPLALLPSGRWFRVTLVFLSFFLVLNYLFIFQSTFFINVTRTIWPAKSFHPAPFPPPEVPRPGAKDYWLWKTKTEFKILPQGHPTAQNWNGTGISGGLHGPGDGTEGCESFPQHLLNKIQVVLKVGSADGKDRTEAQLNTVMRCIPNALVVSDAPHSYGPYRNATDVLASLPAATYLTPDDYLIYERQKNATVEGKPLSPGHAGWKIDKYKFLPSVEAAVQANPRADWFVFLESDTYVFWDNMFRLLASYDASLPYYFGSPSPGRMKPGAEDPDFKGSDREKKVWFAYGGAGFVLSNPAAHRLVDRGTNSFGVKGPRVTDEYMQDVRDDCCGDSILGWALYDKAGVQLSGLWPMFNPHSLHGLPFGTAGGKWNWCAPVITLHKCHTADFERIWNFEEGRDRREVSGFLAFFTSGVFPRGYCAPLLHLTCQNPIPIPTTSGAPYAAPNSCPVYI